MQRRAFLAGLGALAVAGCGGGGGGQTAREPTETATGAGARLPGAPDDAATVAYVLKLEQVEADLYRRAADSGFFKGRELALIQALRDEEDEHVDMLAGALHRLGGKAPAAPETRLALEDRDGVLRVAVRLENLGAAAYLGQLDRIRDRDVLATLLSIHTVEARHATALNLLLGKSPTPNGAFGRPEDMATVLRVLDVYLA
ncbi:MAG TPA: ferritin-like domain-containing protein [Solirubrobacteraceae bacterium]